MIDPASLSAIIIASITLAGGIIAKIIESIKKDESGKYSFKSNCCVFTSGNSDLHSSG